LSFLETFAENLSGKTFLLSADAPRPFMGKSPPNDTGHRKFSVQPDSAHFILAHITFQSRSPPGTLKWRKSSILETPAENFFSD
jgi:hypothetical protein